MTYKMNIAEPQVKFVFLLGSLILSETTYTHICADCVNLDNDTLNTKCKKCLKFKSEKGTLSFQCGTFDGIGFRKTIFPDFSKTSFSDLCSICTKKKDKFDCKQCTKFAAIKGSTTECPTTEYSNTLRLDNFDDTDIAISTSKECASCPECVPTTLATGEGTEEGTSRTQSPSGFESASCQECSPTTTTMKEGSTEKGTTRTKSPSNFASGPIITTVEVSSEEKTSRTKCPFSFDMMSTSNEELQKIKDNLFGYMFGTAVGGALLGSIITAFVFICLRRRTARQKVREPESNALQNLAEGGVIEQLVQDQDTKNTVICNEFNNETIKSQAEFKPDEDGVYNHLNATETIDRDEYYDHARAGPAFETQPDTNNDDYDHARPGPSTASQYDDYGI